MTLPMTSDPFVVKPAREVLMAANGVYWRRYIESCPSCYGGRPKWAGTMPAPPCGACGGTGHREHLSMVPTSDDNDPTLTPYAIYRLLGWEDHEGKRQFLPAVLERVAGVLHDAPPHTDQRLLALAILRTVMDG